MSWGMSVGPVPADELEAAIDAAQLPNNPTAPYSEETLAQFAAAKAAAKALFLTGVVGVEGRYYASFSGHSTENFHNTPGMSANSVSANVYQEYLLA